MKKRFLELAILILTVQLANAQSYQDNLIPYSENGQWGFEDFENCPVIAPMFDAAGRFENGLAPVRLGPLVSLIDSLGRTPLGWHKDIFRLEDAFILVDEKYQLSDNQGNAISEAFDYIGRDENTLWGERDGKAFLLALDGRILSGPFDAIGPEREGLIRVLQDSKLGFISPTGNQMLAPSWDDASHFRHGVARVRQGEGFFLIDKQGNQTSDLYSFIGEFKNGTAFAFKGQNIALLDSSGNLVSAWHESIQRFYFGLFLAYNGKLWCFLDAQGNKVTNLYRWPLLLYRSVSFEFDGQNAQMFNEAGMPICPKTPSAQAPDFDFDGFEPPAYPSGGLFSEELCTEKKDGGFVLVDRQGRYHSGIFAAIGAYQQGLFQARTIEGKAFWLGPTGKPWSAEFDAIYPFYQGLSRVRINDQYAFVGANGNIISSWFEYAYEFSDSLAKVVVGSKVGFIDDKGQWVIAPTYDDASSFAYGLAKVRIGRWVFFIDKQGREQTPRFLNTPEGNQRMLDTAFVHWQGQVIPYKLIVGTALLDQNVYGYRSGDGYNIQDEMVLPPQFIDREIPQRNQHYFFEYNLDVRPDRPLYREIVKNGNSARMFVRQRKYIRYALYDFNNRKISDWYWKIGHASASTHGYIPALTIWRKSVLLDVFGNEVAPARHLYQPFYETGYIAVANNRKVSLLDSTLNQRIPWLDHLEVDHGTIVARDRERYALLDKNLIFITPWVDGIRHDGFRDFVFEQSGNLGVFSPSGNQLLPIVFEEIQALKAGLYLVNQGDSVQIVDDSNRSVGLRYNTLSDFDAYGRAIGRQGALVALADSLGRRLTPWFADCQRPAGGFYVVSDNEGYFLLDTLLRATTQERFDALEYRQDGHYLAKKSERFALLDKQGQRMTVWLDYINLFSESVAVGGVGGRFGYFDSKGDNFIDAVFEDAGSFRGGIARARLDGAYHFISFEKNIVSPGYDYLYPFDGYCAIAKKSGKYALLGPDFQVISPWYDSLSYYGAGYFHAQDRGRHALVSGFGFQETLAYTFDITKSHKLKIIDFQTYALVDANSGEELQRLRRRVPYDARPSLVADLYTERLVVRQVDGRFVLVDAHGKTLGPPFERAPRVNEGEIEYFDNGEWRSRDIYEWLRQQE